MSKDGSFRRNMLYAFLYCPPPLGKSIVSSSSYRVLHHFLKLFPSVFITRIVLNVYVAKYSVQHPSQNNSNNKNKNNNKRKKQHKTNCCSVSFLEPFLKSVIFAENGPLQSQGAFFPPLRAKHYFFFCSLAKPLPWSRHLKRKEKRSLLSPLFIYRSVCLSLFSKTHLSRKRADKNICPPAPFLSRHRH